MRGVLHGRDEELAAIGLLLSAARSGRSGALAIYGDAGSGKTALLEHAVEQASGMRVLRGTCVESEAELAFAGLHLLLRPAMGSVDLLPQPQAAALRAAFGLADSSGADRFLAGLATLTLLTELADGGPLLCVCDDAHWLDQASATALLFAARRLDAEGIAICLASRGGGLIEGAADLPALILRPLDRDASARVLAEHAAALTPAVRDRIIEMSQGNPLALIELPTALTAREQATRLDPWAFYVGTLPVSSRVQDAFAEQIARLPEPTRLLLLVASADDTEDLRIIGRAAAELGASLADVAPAQAARLVEVTGGMLRFRHPLIRSAAYQAGAPASIAVHRALAHALAHAGQPVREAWHLAAGASGPDETIAARLERAAQSARDRGGYAAEAAAYERAAALSTGDEATGRRLMLASAATMAAGQMHHAGALADRAARLVREPPSLARLAEIRAAAEFDNGSPRWAARTLLDGSAPIAGTVPSHAARMLLDAVHSALYGCDPDTASKAADMLGRLELPAPLDAFRPAAAGLACLLRGELTAGVPMVARTLETLGETALTLPPGLRRVAATCALAAGDDQLAHDLVVSLAAQCREQGGISLLPYALQVLAIAQQYLGRLADARANACEGLRIAEDTGQRHRFIHLNAILGRISAIEGDEKSCRELCGPASAHESPPVAGTAGTSLSLLDLGSGRYDDALARLEELLAGPARYTFILTYSLPDLVEAAAATHRPEAGAAALARFEEFSSVANQPWAAAAALRCRAQLGRNPEENFQQAARLHSDGARPFERARTELAYGRWLRRGRRRADARAPLESALAAFSHLGAVPWAEQARGELRAAGASVDGPARSGLATRLTAQELQVVRRAAVGMSNREIAAELFLSPRTVGYHLYKAYPKLGVTSRGQLARLDLLTS